MNYTLNLSGIENFSKIDNIYNNMTCILNQQSMMKATNNLYIFAFFMSLIIMCTLIFFFWIQPRFKKVDELLELEPVRFVLGLSILLTLIQLYTNLGLSPEALNIIQSILWIILIGLGILIGWKFYQKYKDKLKEVKI